MRIANRIIGDEYPVFVVAEIGQNHQGSLQIAKQMILKAKEIGADCVKFQKSCLTEKFTRQALERPYENANSWGSTYGEHKSFLEFSVDDYEELLKFCAEIGILFSASAMDPVSLKQLTQLNLPFIKIGSGDADNVQFLKAVAALDTPVIISTGMQSWAQVKLIHSIFYKKSAAILHCVSSYPTPPGEALLNLIQIYRNEFQDFVIGYSGHELGLQTSVASVLLGARIVERHFTLDNSWKGTDHKCSLNPEKFQKLIQYIRIAENLPIVTSVADVERGLKSILQPGEFCQNDLIECLKPLTQQDRKLLPSEIPCHAKLGKSLVFAKYIEVGQVIKIGDLTVKVSEPRGLSPTKHDQMIGQTAARCCYADEPVLEEDFVK
ncbi:sialic acid synthase-like [Uranotaenia lowii]|uniref:sialic acid synthase-like n=1 Tax=Uranotaenia lowii TaxID=190385 RepID=UPI00247842E2|nr:sialic acid synthase-like [Uranotaenia lowii]XP_055613029.1 sialic acid synthase-like [Uranotaenia lowii]